MLWEHAWAMRLLDVALLIFLLVAGEGSALAAAALERTCVCLFDRHSSKTHRSELNARPQSVSRTQVGIFVGPRFAAPAIVPGPAFWGSA